MSEFTDSEQKTLLLFARETIGFRLHLNEEPDVKSFSDKKFQEERGVFVTLEENGSLRGCIGNILPVYPLVEAIQKNAIAAAFEDPRFAPVIREEFEKITLEISVLTTPKPVSYSSPDELLNKVRPNIDGVVLKNGYFSSTFLPQVWEKVSGPEEFFEHLSLKAGLAPDAWMESEIQTYQVEKWSEQ